MPNQFYDLFDLRKDQELPHLIDETIRSGVKVVGTNLWVLIFAILIASVGLNVNSTAVIIGAMLISPLMGPIVGIGYGTGINDVTLIKLALRNLAIFTFISILSSTLYFTLSPLNTVTPELLARTSPNLWDVLIAFFGGAAGIIALTRKSISNVIPGVAIATALMPPLCTAGYGISQGNWEFFGGAFFLYCINSVFIALATLVFVKLFKLPQHKNLDEITTKRTNILIGITTFLMIVPSAYLAYNFVQQNEFNASVSDVISSASKDPNYVILGKEIDSIKREIILTIGGDNPPDNLAGTIKSRLKSRGVDNVQVMVRLSGSGQIDMTSLKSELRNDLFKNLQDQVNTLSADKERLTKQASRFEQDKQLNALLFEELRTQYQNVTQMTVSRGEQFSVASTAEAAIETVQVDTTQQKQSDTVEKNAHQATSAKPSLISNSDVSTHEINTNEPTKQASATQIVATKTDTQPTSKTVRLISLSTKTALSEAELQRIESWLAVRFKGETVVLKTDSQDINLQKTEAIN